MCLDTGIAVLPVLSLGTLKKSMIDRNIIKLYIPSH